MNRVSTEDPRPDATRDLAEAIAIRQEGGSAAPEVLARAFLEQMHRDIESQVDQRVQAQLANYRGGKASKKASNHEKELALGMALGSMGIAVPLSGIAGYFGGFPGIALVWICILLINVAWSQRRS